jgi:hypothetical protein
MAGKEMTMSMRRVILLLAAVACLSAPLTRVAAQQAGGQGAQEEAHALLLRVQSGDLASMTDDELVDFFKRIDPPALLDYLRAGASAYPQYELWMRREERIRGRWPAQPALNYIKFSSHPLRIYVRWLAGGAKAGQEVLYDETRRKDAMYGHLGGFLGGISTWTSLDGPLARDNSNHPITDLSLQSVTRILAAEQALYREEGASPAPQEVAVERVHGFRCVALTWVAPSPRHYAGKTRMCFDLSLPIVRQIESWNDAGQLQERLQFLDIRPAQFTDMDFDPDNKAYHF